MCGFWACRSIGNPISRADPIGQKAFLRLITPDERQYNLEPPKTTLCLPTGAQGPPSIIHYASYCPCSLIGFIRGWRAAKWSPSLLEGFLRKRFVCFPWAVKLSRRCRVCTYAHTGKWMCQKYCSFESYTLQIKLWPQLDGEREGGRKKRLLRLSCFYQWKTDTKVFGSNVSLQHWILSVLGR